MKVCLKYYNAVCITYQHMVCHAFYVCIDIVHALYYVPCTDEHAMFLTNTCMQLSKFLLVIALLEMVCIAYHHTACNMYYTFTDFMGAFYYVACI